jgi:dimethylglycine dehydrogenase
MRGADRRHRLYQASGQGPRCDAFLDWFTTNKLPKVGRINLTYALTDHRHHAHRIHHRAAGRDEYYLVSAGAWAAYDGDYLLKSAEDFMAAGGGYIEIQT